MKSEEFENAIEDSVVRYVANSKNKSEASSHIVAYLFECLSSTVALRIFRDDPSNSPRIVKRFWNELSKEHCSIAMDAFKQLVASGYTIEDMDAEAEEKYGA